MSCSGSREIGPQNTWYTADEVSVPPNLKTKIEQSFPPQNSSFIHHIPRHPTNLWVQMAESFNCPTCLPSAHTPPQESVQG